MLEAPKLPNDEKRLAVLDGTQLIHSAREERFDRLARLASQTFNVPIALVSLVAKDKQWFKATVGLDVDESPRNISFCGHAIADPSSAFVVNDATLDGRFADNPFVTGDLGLRFYAGYPIKVAGEAIGTLCLIDTKPRSLTAEQIKCLGDFAALLEEEVALEAKIMARSAELKVANDKLAEVVNELSTRAERIGEPAGRRLSELIHEMASPVGNASLIIESMGEKLDSAMAKASSGALRKSDLAEHWIKSKEACRQLEANIKRASDLLQSYKSVGGRRADGECCGDCEVFEVDDAVDRALEAMGPTLAAATAHASWVGPKAEVKLAGRQGPFEQVLVNLIANAIHHGCSGRENGRIELSASLSESKEGGQVLTLNVADDGRGILPNHAQRLFEPYFTTRAGLGGTGLGLHVSRRIVRSMFSGDLTAKNKDPHGACFSMELQIRSSQD